MKVALLNGHLKSGLAALLSIRRFWGCKTHKNRSVISKIGKFMNHHVEKIICAAILGVQGFYGAHADVLELKNKSVLDGKYAGGTSETIRFQVGAETKVIPLSDIVALTITGTKPGAASSGQAAPNSGGSGSATGVAAGSAAGAAATGQPAAAASFTVPAGTELVVLMDRAVDSARDSAGTRFTGKLQKDVAVNGQVAIPAGSMVAGQVNQAKEAGRLAGQSVLGLTLTAITIKGQEVPVATEDFTLAGAQEGRKTARRAAGGAAIGAMADGGEGAAKGAAIGSATALRKGEAQVVPVGAAVPFRLTQPVTVKSGGS